MKVLIYLTIVGLSVGNHHDEARSSPLNLSCDCGGRRNNMMKENALDSKRIVGGKETLRNEYPWMVHLDSGCGGSIITQWHILTAAHCTYGIKPNQVVVFVGKHARPYEIDKIAKEYFVAKIIHHEEYDHQVTLVNDIAILVLRTRINFNENVSPICLPSKRKSFDGAQLKVMGWGETLGTGDRNALREVDVTGISLSNCKRYWRRLRDDGKQMCTWDDKKSSCNGDSGGPLVYLDEDTQRYTQAAVVSYGDEDCGYSIMPSVYTDVFGYIDWINNVTLTTVRGVKACSKIVGS